MSEVYLYDPTTYEVLFEFDADIKEERSGTTKWTDKPVEDGANIADFGNRGPLNFTVSGVITAWPFNALRDPLRVSGADAALESIADAGQPVGLITKWWAREVVIASDKAGADQGKGEALYFSIGCKTIRVPKAEYTQIPPSKLKARVRKRATPKPTTGGAAAGKTPKKQQQDWITSGTDYLKSLFK